MTAGLKLHQLESLIAVADHGSVRAAASQLGRSPTAVSNAIRELEQTVDTVLLERRADGVVLTDAGAALFAHARLIFGQLQRASDEVTHMTQRRGGTIKIAITPWLLHGVLPRIVDEFGKLRPDVQLDIAEHLGNEYPAVRNGQLDFAIGPQPDGPTDHALKIQPLCRYSFAAVCRHGHPAAEARTFDELIGYNWLLSRSVDRIAPEIRTFIEDQSQDGVCRFHYARSVHAALAVVRSTNMLTIVPWPMIETPDMRDRYIALNLKAPMRESGSCLVTRRYEPIKGAALMFLETFRLVAREMAASTDPHMRRMFSMIDTEGIESYWDG
ncbi:LysR substrate-binding domain-containing protein [Burkholderia sp. MR1-5-21]